MTSVIPDQKRMRSNRTKLKIDQGRAVVGTFIYTMDQAVVEIAGVAGLDFVIIDTEHVALDIRTAADLIRIAFYGGATPIVRLRSADDPRVMNLLEAGAQGFVVPNVTSADEIHELRSRVLYPPRGSRGSCSVSPAAEYGRWRADFAGYMQNADQNLLLVAQIESQRGMDNINAISSAGVDVILPGRVDLAASMGRGAEADHPQVIGAISQMWRVANPETTRGVVIYTTSELSKELENGYRFIVHSTDQHILMASFREVCLELQAHDERNE
jgi:4-hydroxy-2-oxoheptanedioate aldolase